MPEQDISKWTPTLLTKFIKDVLTRDPQRFSQQLVVETLRVTSKLTVEDQVVFDQSSNFQVVGNTGQPPFASGWTNYGSPYSKAAFVKRPDGFIQLTGVIKSGTVGSAAFTLPPGYRPAVAPGPYAVMSNGGLGRVDIGTDGTVTPISPSSNLSVSLEGISFKAA